MAVPLLSCSLLTAAPQFFGVLYCKKVGTHLCQFPTAVEDTESHHLLLAHCDEVSPLGPLLVLKLHLSSRSEPKNMLCEISKDVCAVPASKELLMYFHQSIAESYKSHFSAENAYICKSCL